MEAMRAEMSSGTCWPLVGLKLAVRGFTGVDDEVIGTFAGSNGPELAV